MVNINRGKQIVSVNGRGGDLSKVHGVQSVSISQNTNVQPIVGLGVGFYTGVSNNVGGSVSIDKLLVENDSSYYDPMRDTFYCNVSGQHSYGITGSTNSARFEKARLNSYSLECSVGGFVQEGFAFDVLGNISGREAYEEPSDTFDYDTVVIPTYGSVNIYIDDVESNFVQSFSLSASLNPIGNNFMGSGVGAVDVEYPDFAKVEVSCQFNVTGFVMSDLYSKLCDNIESLSIDIREPCGSTIRSISMGTGFYQGGEINGSQSDINVSANTSYVFFVPTGLLSGALYG